ncbi:MAG: hypothetical protein AB7P49_00630 [Bdellovibrionales bacterium]
MATSEEDFKIDPALLKFEPPSSLLNPSAFDVDLTPEEKEQILNLQISGGLTPDDIKQAETLEWNGKGVLPDEIETVMPAVTISKPMTQESLRELLEKSDAEFTSAVSSSVEGAASAYIDGRFELLKTKLFARLLKKDLQLKDIPQAVRDVISGDALADIFSVSIWDAIKDVTLGVLDDVADFHDRVNTMLVSSYDRFQEMSERFTLLVRNVLLKVIVIKAKTEKVVFTISSKWMIRVIKILFTVTKIVLWILKWVLKVICIILGKALGWSLKPVIPVVLASLSPLLLLSKSSTKRDISEMTTKESDAIFSAVSSLPLRQWKYKGQDVRHFGPMAEEFANAFSNIIDPSYTGTINVADALFLLMSATQTLAAKNNELTKRLEAIESQVQK